MGIFQLGKVPLGKSDLNTGHKLPLGKLDLRLFTVSINLPLDETAVLHDYSYGTGKSTLKPCLDNMNFSIDRINKKITMEFYIDNRAEETTSPFILFDEMPNASLTTDLYGSGTVGTPTLTTETGIVAEGGNCAKVVAATGAAQYGGLKYDFGANQNLNTYDFLYTYVYGNNDGSTFWVCCEKGDNTKRWAKTFTDNWNGWKRIPLPLKQTSYWTALVGSIDWTAVQRIRVLNNSSNKTWYIDRTLFDLGMLATVEISIPNYLNTSTNNPVTVSAWRTGTSAYDSPFAGWNPMTGASVFANGNRLWLLSNTALRVIYGGVEKWANFLSGKKDQTKGYVYGDSSLTVTYRQKGTTKLRTAIALKTPPSDLNQTSSNGIGSSKWKIEINYA